MLTTQRTSKAITSCGWIRGALALETGTGPEHLLQPLPPIFTALLLALQPGENPTSALSVLITCGTGLGLARIDTPSVAPESKPVFYSV